MARTVCHLALVIDEAPGATLGAHIINTAVAPLANDVDRGKIGDPGRFCIADEDVEDLAQRRFARGLLDAERVIESCFDAERLSFVNEAFRELILGVVFFRHVTSIYH